MSNFDRSSYMKQRHLRAKKQQQLYQSKFSKDAKYYDFLKNNNPLQQSVQTYQVSYQISYIGDFDSLITKWSTFEVTTYEQNAEEIKQKTMNMLLDSRGQITGDMFNQGAQEVIKDNTTINVEPKIYPRGAEKKQQQTFKSVEEIEDIYSNKYKVVGVDKLKFENKKKRKGEMKLDFRHF